MSDQTILADIGCAFIPGPGLGRSAFERRLAGHRSWSLCGITHTLLSDRAMDALTTTVSEPVEDWDAIICTSHVARTVIETLFSTEEERLSQRLGAHKFTRPQLPVIPLGVDVEALSSLTKNRGHARKKLGIGDDETVILFVGRLSFHAKAHPWPMYQALAELSDTHKICLLEYGQYFNDHIRDSFDELHVKLAPSLRRIVLDGKAADSGKDAWAAADIFCSLSDNFQETFGLTPLEAKAVGLPVVVSDWNGYRETVRDGVDGYRIATMTPPPHFGHDIVKRYALGIDNYDIYCGQTSLMVGIDVRATREAFRALIENPALRKEMGYAAQTHARSHFDWSLIIRQYQDLWAELAARRQSAFYQDEMNITWPARLDPFHVFRSYATAHFDPSTKLIRRSHDNLIGSKNIFELSSLSLAKMLVDSVETFTAVIEQFSFTEPRSVAELASLDKVSSTHHMASVALAFKLGFLARAEDAQ